VREDPALSIGETSQSTSHQSPTYR